MYFCWVRAYSDRTDEMIGQWLVYEMRSISSDDFCWQISREDAVSLVRRDLPIFGISYFLEIEVDSEEEKERRDQGHHQANDSEPPQEGFGIAREGSTGALRRGGRFFRPGNLSRGLRRRLLDQLSDRKSSFDHRTGVLRESSMTWAEIRYLRWEVWRVIRKYLCFWKWRRRMNCHGTIDVCQYLDRPNDNGGVEAP